MKGLTWAMKVLVQISDELAIRQQEILVLRGMKAPEELRHMVMIK